MVKLVINKCYGGFGLSEQAYERLIALGVPVRKYIEPHRGPDGLCLKEPLNDGEAIFDRTLEEPSEIRDAMLRLGRRYWETWLDGNRRHPLLIQVVEELGESANGRHAELKIVEVPDGVDFEIEEYDGIEWVAETHRTWR